MNSHIKGSDSTRSHAIKLVTIPLAGTNASKTSTTQITSSSQMNSKAGEGSKTSAATTRASNSNKESFASSSKDFNSHALKSKKQLQATRQKSATNQQLTKFPSSSLTGPGTLMSNNKNATIVTSNSKPTNYNLKTAYIKLTQKTSKTDSLANSRSNSKNSVKERPTTNGRVLGISKQYSGGSRSGGISSPLVLPSSSRI